MNKNIPNKIIMNRLFIYSILLLLIQQIIVASSTFWIAKLAESINSSSDETMYYLSLFIASLVIVFLPGGYSTVILEKAKYFALNEYLSTFKMSFWNKPNLRSDKSLKNERQPFLSSECFLVIEEAYNFYYDWVSVFLNVLLNVVALALVLEISIVYSYIVGIFFVSVFILNTKNIIHKRAKIAQQERTKLQRVFSLAWDNILIGNKLNFSIFNNTHQSSQKQTSKAISSSDGWNKFISSVGMILIMIPVLSWTVYLFWNARDDLSVLSVMIATLPRQVMILQFSYSIIYYATSYKALSTKITGLKNSVLLPLGIVAPESRIKFEKIEIFDSTKKMRINSLDDLVNLLISTNNRLTIRGPNGCGKSTLLSSLKEILGAKSFYLPAHHDLMFHKTDSISLSTGQILKEELLEIQESDLSDIEVILLDEWDANLDPIASRELDSLIKKISQKLKLVEIRHH